MSKGATWADWVWLNVYLDSTHELRNRAREPNPGGNSSTSTRAQPTGFSHGSDSTRVGLVFKSGWVGWPGYIPIPQHSVI